MYPDGAVLPLRQQPVSHPAVQLRLPRQGTQTHVVPRRRLLPLPVRVTQGARIRHEGRHLLQLSW